MIKYFRRSQKTQTREIKAYKPGTWVYVEKTDEKELEQLSRTHKLDFGHVLDVLDEDEMPRLEKEDGQLYIFTRFPITNDELQLETRTLLLIMDKDKLVSISQSPIPRFQEFINNVINFDTEKPDQLMLKIMHQIIEQYDIFLTQISRQIKSIRSRLRVEKIGNKDFVDFVVIQDELNEFISALTPTDSILRRLLINRHLNLSTRDKELIDDLLLSNRQSIEAAKSSIKSVASIREAYATIMSNNLNQVIRILTVLTVIIAIPTRCRGSAGAVDCGPVQRIHI